MKKVSLTFYYSSFLTTIFMLLTVLMYGQQYKVSDVDIIKRTFTNPIYKGADPWMIKHNDMYYTCRSGNRGVIISESRFLTRREKEATVWKAPENAWNSFFIWAPELHHIDGKWYIYYAAGKIDKTPFIYQRTGVLMCDTPLGEYKDMGMLHTGDDPLQREENNIWGIDMTVFKHKGKLYAVWSGWEQNSDTDATDQHLYIARMPTPTSIGKRILLTKAVEPWEKGEHIVLVEGPSVIKHDGNIFIMYSTRGSWTPNYRLGQLRLKSEDSNPLDPTSWIKSGPVFQGNPRVLGVGHASFTTSPDDTQHWIYYHTKTSQEPGWTDRKACLQQFYFDEDGNPWFGAAVPAGVSIDRPSGEYEREIEELIDTKK
jgi:GH43 family beta-xylosidase